MRRVATLFAVLIALLIPAAIAAAGSPNHDSVNGGGQNCCDVIHINAKSGPLGEDATGHWSQNGRFDTGPPSKGEVVCLDVRGNLAVAGVRITRQGGGSSGNQTGIFQYVQDNGEPNQGQDRSASVPTATPEACHLAQAPAQLFPLTHGNFQVRDATP